MAHHHLLPLFEKKIRYSTKGVDQLGHYIGQPVKGDHAKIHLRGYFVEHNKPLFRVGKKAFFVRKQVFTEFLSTHMLGETAFLDLPIPSWGGDNKPLVPTLQGILTKAVRTMHLGESATITFTTSDEGIADRIHRGHYEAIPPNTLVTFEVDLFRIVRDGKLHCRPTRNGTGGMGYACATM